MISKLRFSVNLTALAIASGILVTAPANAADLLPPQQFAPPPPPPTIGWGGLYVGGHVGFGEADFDGIFDGEDILEEDGTPTLFFGDLELDGLLGGVHAGFNWDAGAFVLGVEGDVSFMDWDDALDATAIVPDNSEVITAEVDMLASIRARLGMPLGVERRFLPYVTAGVAWADAEASAFSDGTDETEPDSRHSYEFDDVGGVVGGGVEYAITDALRLRGESLFYFFDDKHGISVDDVETADTGDFVELENIWTVRVGASWYFSTPGF